MDIKDFIKGSLLQIVDGITEANTALEAKDAFIPINGVLGRFPYLGVDNHQIHDIVYNCIIISRQNWNSHETVVYEQDEGVNEVEGVLRGT